MYSRTMIAKTSYKIELDAAVRDQYAYVELIIRMTLRSARIF